jgi:hypothetical protein
MFFYDVYACVVPILKYSLTFLTIFLLLDG